MAHEPDDRPLFGSLVISDPAKPHRSRAMPCSLAAHILAIGLMGAFALFRPDEMPHTDPISVLLYDPPPPPPPPMLRGSASVEKQKEARPTTPEQKPDPDKLTQPDERPKEAELKPENGMRQSEQKGVADGSDLGSEEGMEGGVEGGQVGGVPGGVLGGVLGGTGVATDWDQPPRLLRQTKPEYPADAFTKRIEGIVDVEFVVELSGRVEHARAVSGPHILHAAALQAVRQWVFVPGVKDGKPVRTRHTAPVRFRII